MTALDQRLCRVDQARFLLGHLRGLGVTVQIMPCGGIVTASPFEVGEEVRSQIKALKPELLELLRGEDSGRMRIKRRGRK